MWPDLFPHNDGEEEGADEFGLIQIKCDPCCKNNESQNNTPSFKQKLPKQ